jgi:hypothetical protein
MKSRVQRKSLRKSRRQSQRRKIQKGGMTIQDAREILDPLSSSAAGINFLDTMEKEKLLVSMSNNGLINDGVFQCVLYLVTKFGFWQSDRYTWQNAVTLVKRFTKPDGSVNYKPFYEYLTAQYNKVHTSKDTQGRPPIPGKEIETLLGKPIPKPSQRKRMTDPVDWMFGK